MTFVGEGGKKKCFYLWVISPSLPGHVYANFAKVAANRCWRIPDPKLAGALCCHRCGSVAQKTKFYLIAKHQRNPEI